MDDYGERDPSLHCYQTAANSSAPRSDETFGMTHSQAKELLQQRLNALHRCSFGGDVHIDSNGELTFTTTAGQRDNVKISIRPDTLAVVIATVVHKWNQAPAVVMTNNDQRRLKTRCPYSLVTKMMKHKTLLKAASFAGEALDGVRYVDIVDDNVVLVCNFSVTILSSDRTFMRSFASYIWKATEISKDFANTKDADQKRERQNHESKFVGGLQRKPTTPASHIL